MHEIIIVSITLVWFSILLKKITKIKIYTAIFIIFLLNWILFLNVNPYDPEQNKYTLLSAIPENYIPRMTMWKNTDTYKYPVIFKPVKCSKNGKGVKMIKNRDDAKEYIKNSNSAETMVQTFVPYQNEITILYENKHIVAMVLKKSSQSEIMTSCYGNVTCEDITHLMTPALNAVITNISKHIPNFNMGRYDIKYRDLPSLLAGKHFYILEVNGTLGFDLRKSSPRYFGTQSLFYIERWFFSRLIQGLTNILTLQGYNPLQLVKIMGLTLYNTVECGDWVKLLAIYG